MAVCHNVVIKADRKIGKDVGVDMELKSDLAKDITTGN